MKKEWLFKKRKGYTEFNSKEVKPIKQLINYGKNMYCLTEDSQILKYNGKTWVIILKGKVNIH